MERMEESKQAQIDGKVGEKERTKDRMKQRMIDRMNDRHDVKCIPSRGSLDPGVEESSSKRIGLRRSSWWNIVSKTRDE